MAVKVIVELKARPGQRDGLRSLFEQLATRDRASAYHEGTYYESLDGDEAMIGAAQPPGPPGWSAAR